jgi:transposase
MTEIVYIGVDLHVRRQTVCWCSTGDGEVQERELDHRRDDVRAFYRSFSGRAVVGIESSGYAGWFHRLMKEVGHELVVGDAYAIRQYARRRQKNDRRDAALLLDLLLRGDFPAVHVPAPASQEVLRLLRYRHRLVRMRTTLKNGLQAIALSYQGRLRSGLFTSEGWRWFRSLPLDSAERCQQEHSQELLSSLNEHIGELEEELRMRAADDVRVGRLRTHPGVGLLTALAVVHALEPVARFRRARQVAAYCGLDPMEHSSGETQRYGHISKQGNRLLRFLLIEAAHNTIRGDEDLRRFYFHLAQRRNSGVAATALARKLVLRLYAMLRDQIDYDELRSRGRDAGCARDYAGAQAAGH